MTSTSAEPHARDFGDAAEDGAAVGAGAADEAPPPEPEPLFLSKSAMCCEDYRLGMAYPFGWDDDCRCTCNVRRRSGGGANRNSNDHHRVGGTRRRSVTEEAADGSKIAGHVAVEVWLCLDTGETTSGEEMT